MDILLGLGTFLIQNAESFVGVVLVVLIDYLNKDVRTELERFLVTVIACLFTAAIIHHDELLYGSPEQVLQTATLIFAESQVVFKLYFKRSWLRWQMQRFLQVGKEERATIEPQETMSIQEDPQH